MESREGEEIGVEAGAETGAVAAGRAASGGAGRLGGLDTLRGVAILFVILFHVALRFPQLAPRSGLVDGVENQGVQLFFLVSAYTMAVMWAARTGERRRTLRFYIRRVCRIAPLYWLAVIGYSALAGWSASPLAVAANVALVHGLVPGAINAVVPGGWSIGVEMAFYALFPLVALLPPRRLLAAGLGWHLLFGIGVGSALLRAGADPTDVYYTAFTQVPVFLCGLYLFHLLRSPAAAAPLANAGVAAAWIAVSVAARAAGLPGRPLFWAGIALLGGAMWAVLRFDLSVRPLRFLGRLSYSMYLFHFAAILLVAAVAPDLAYPAAFVAVGAVTVLASLASFRTLEAWSQALGRRLVAAT